MSRARCWPGPPRSPTFTSNGTGRTCGSGWPLLIYGIAVYPLLNVAFGHSFPAVPTFGLPCPTTIFTLGLLWWLHGGHVRILLVIPLLWSAVGGSAAFALGVPQDLGLLVAGALPITLLRRKEP